MFFPANEEEPHFCIDLNERLDDDFNKENKDNENDLVNYNQKAINIIPKISLKERTTCANSKDLLESPKVFINNFSHKDEKISENILQEEVKANKKQDKMKCGRKRMRHEENNEKVVEHNKYSDDNLRRKCKHLVIKNTMAFINKSIRNKYNGNIGNGIFKKELQTLNQKQKSDATINFNQNFLSKNLGEIFSEDITGRFTNLPLNHNKILITKLMNEEDEEKREYFNKLFNITFIDCLNHFNQKIIIPELIGLKCFSEIKDQILKKYPEDGEDYYSSLKFYFDNFNVIIMNKRARNSRKKNIIEIN